MKILEFLQSYDGKPLRFMEVCGTHTAEIHRNGIPALLPPSIELVSGPGCPVCVTVSAYIDRLIELGMDPKNCIVTFGDMLRVPGSAISLGEARAQGCSVRMVYSPMDALRLAKADPDHGYIFAAVGFETTTPVYALLVQEALEQGVKNLRLLTSLKVMPPAIDWICAHNSADVYTTGEIQESIRIQPAGEISAPAREQIFRENRESQRIHGFLAPGHVSVITGSRIFEPLARKYGLPFVVAGFLSIQKKVAQAPKAKILLAMCGAFAFVLSALKIPSFEGSCSHPTGVGLGAILFGPMTMAVLGLIVLLFQALLLAHGGLTTLGANTFSMAIAGPIVSWAVYKLLRKANAPAAVAVFAAAALGDLFTYVVTSVQLGVVHGGIGKFLMIFAVTQIPLAIAEGLLTVVVFNVLEKYSREELHALCVL